MAETTFGDAIAEKENAIVPQQNQVAEYQTGDCQGHTDSSDIIRPRLQIVAKSSKLTSDFQAGSFVLSKAVSLGRGPIRLACLMTRKFFREVTDPESGEMGKLFNLPSEAQAAGFRVSDNPSDKTEGSVVPAADLLVWVEKPESVKDEDLFVNPLPSGRIGALAIWSVNGTNYSSIYRMIYSAKETNAFLKKNGIVNQEWESRTELKENKNFAWWQASLKPAGRLNEADVQYLKELV